MQRRTFCSQAVALAITAAVGPLATASAAPAQIRIDVEVFNLNTERLPEAAQPALRRLRRETTLSGAEAEKTAELLRRLEGQQLWAAGRYSREVEEGRPITVRLGRRRQQAPGYGLTLTPTVHNGSIDVEAELRTGKPQTGACDPLVRSFSVKVPMGGYVAFWLTAQEAGKPDAVVIARFHPSE